MAASLKEIAKSLGVSPSTVSKALNNRPGVSDEVRQRILDTIESSGLRPRQTAGGLTKDSSIHVNLLVCTTPVITADPFYSIIVEILAHTLQSLNVTPLLTRVASSPLRVEELEQTFKNHLSHGVVAIGATLKADFLEEARRLQIPVLLVDNRHDGLSSVNPDNLNGGITAVSHLHDLGHQNIAFLSGPRTQISQRERFEAYQAGLRLRQLAERPEWVFEAQEASVAGGTEELLRRPNVGYSAVFAATDKLAIGAMKAIREMGLRVGEDISVIGFDGIEWGEHSDPPLSTIQIAKEQIGRVAAHTVYSLIQDPEMMPMDIRVGTRLVARESTAAAQ